MTSNHFRSPLSSTTTLAEENGIPISALAHARQRRDEYQHAVAVPEQVEEVMGMESTRETAYSLSIASNEKLILVAIKSFLFACILQHGMLPSQQTVSTRGQYFSLHQATLRHMTYQVFENLYGGILGKTRRPNTRIVAALGGIRSAEKVINGKIIFVHAPKLRLQR